MRLLLVAMLIACSTKTSVKADDIAEAFAGRIGTANVRFLAADGVHSFDLCIALDLPHHAHCYGGDGESWGEIGFDAMAGFR